MLAGGLSSSPGDQGGAQPEAHYNARSPCAAVLEQEMRVFGFAGYSGSGKTTLIEKLIPLLRARGLSVSLIKHTHHGFDIDKPGKDSYRFRAAGAGEVMLAGEQRWALMRELRDEAQPSLAQLLDKLSPCDLVLVEGFKSAELPKIEVHRPATGHPMILDTYPNVVAVASDAALDVSVPVLDLNDVAAVARFVLAHVGLALQGEEQAC